jgi:hypothetical protein
MPLPIHPEDRLLSQPLKAAQNARSSGRTVCIRDSRNKTPMFHRRDVVCFVVAVLHRTIAIRKHNHSRHGIRFPA